MATNSKFSADLGLKTDADLQVDGNVTVSGNLTVNGTQTTVNSTTTSVEDSMLELANSNLSSDTLDIGIYGNYDDGLGDGVSEYTGFFRDATDSTWKLFDGLESEPTTTVNTSGTGYTLADLQVGDLTATTLTATNALTGSSITYPTSDGTNGQFLKTNGSGVLSFGDIPTQYTDSDARSAISAGTGISYDSSTGVITNTVSNTDTTYSLATSSTLGLVKVGYAENSQNYPVELDNGQMYVNVPWVDTNTDTNTTYSAGTGLTLSGTTFSSNITQYTDANARSAISAGTGISYDSSTGVITSTASGGVDGITSSANATAITIDSSERVGINTSSPSTELHVYSADQNALKVQTNTGINQIELANSTNSPTYLTQDSYGFQIKADENGWGGSNSFFSVKVKAAERMRISSDGYITAPNQVAFSVAKNNGYQTDDNVFVCDSQTGSRNHNDGSHYNTSNGRFTAPVAGRYWFSFSVQTHDSGGVVQAWVALRKNGSVVQYNLQHKTGGYHTRFDMSISLKLAANDYIEAYVGESGTSSGWQGSASEYNNFSGFLIG
jgi:hypothetical protein